MKRNQFLILLVLLFVTGGGGLLLVQRDNATWTSSESAPGGPVLPGLDVNAVRRVVIRRGDDQVTLAQERDAWRVQERSGYPARYEGIVDLLMRLRQLKVVQAEPLAESRRARLDLAPPGKGDGAGTGLELQGADGRVMASLLIGKTHVRGGDGGYPDGRFVLVPARSGTVAVVADPLSDVVAEPARWLARDLVRIERPRTVARTGPGPDDTWAAMRATESGDWTLHGAEGGRKLDVSRFNSLQSSLSGLAFTDLETAAPPSEADFERADRFLIDTFDGLSYTLSVSREVAGKRYARLAVSGAPPSERAPGKDEEAEEKARLDSAFQADLRRLKARVAWLQESAGATYVVSPQALQSLLVPRGQFFVADTPPVAPPAGAPGATGVPRSAGAVPPPAVRPDNR